MKSKNNENPVRTTTLEVVSRAKDVVINKEKIKEVAETWIKEGVSSPCWLYDMHYVSKDEETMLTYYILLDSLNFCFWPSSHKKKKWYIVHERKQYNGYFGLSLTLRKFFETQKEKANFEYLKSISYKEFVSLLGGKGDLQLTRERSAIVRGVSEVICKKYKGSAIRFVESSNRKLSVLIPKIAQELPSFNDVAYAGSKKIYLWKRAQILGLDIYGAFEGKGKGYFEDPEYATAFPDYKLPQILRFWGIFEYSKSLAKRVDEEKLIKPGSREEIEIRSATVWAVEYLCDELKKYGRNFHAYEVDWILWNKSQEIKLDKPYHHTKTVFY